MTMEGPTTLLHALTLVFRLQLDAPPADCCKFLYSRKDPLEFHLRKAASGRRISFVFLEFRRRPYCF